MKKLFFIACVTLGICSCGFLDEQTDTFLLEEETCSSESALEARIYGILDGFYGDYLMMGYQNELLHTASGLLMWKGQRTQDTWTDGLKFAKYSTSSANQNWFSEYYSAIGRCNRLLDNLPGSPVDESYKKAIEAEARFYRAVLYFYLVRLYGDVPLILKSPRTVEETNSPRTVYYKVYAQILEDLSFAELNMRDKQTVQALTPNRGRPFKWAATAMKASVYTTIGSILTSFEADPNDQFFDVTKDASCIASGKDPRTPDFSASSINCAKDAWEKALEASESVIASGQYALAPDYRQLFRWTEPEDFKLDERIFVLQSTNSTNAQGKIELMSLPQYAEGTSNITKNGNAGRWRPSRFLFQKFAQDNGGALGTGTNNKNIYVSCPDPRFNASFYHTAYKRVDNGKNFKLYPDKNYVICSNSSYAFPYCRKYCDPKFDVTSGYADFYLMRYAEMYLISAEASANLADSPSSPYWTQALERIEALHARARASVDEGSEQAVYPSWNGRSFSGKQELINAIFWEREYEMCCEGHEWFDTHRMGARWLGEQIAAPLNEHLKSKEQGPGLDYNKEQTVGVFAYNYISTPAPTSQQELRSSLLCAFPTVSETTYNTAIDPVRDRNDFQIK